MPRARGGGIGEPGIAGCGIAPDLRAVARGQGPGLIDADGFGGGVGRPIVAIGGQGDHHPAGIQALQPAGQHGRDPVLAGDRTGCGVGPALVVGHQHHSVSRRRERRQRLVFRDRGGDPDLLARRREGRLQRR